MGIGGDLKEKVEGRVTTYFKTYAVRCTTDDGVYVHTGVVYCKYICGISYRRERKPDISFEYGEIERTRLKPFKARMGKCLETISEEEFFKRTLAGEAELVVEDLHTPRWQFRGKA